MKAFIVEKYGKSGLRAAHVPESTIGPRDVLVRVRAASINPLDKMVRNGEFKRLLKYKTPFVLGHDVAGVVTRVGDDVREYGRRRGLRPTPRPAYWHVRRVHCHRPCGHRAQATLTHDGGVGSDPAGGACRVAGAGRSRAGEAGAESPRSRWRRRTRLDSHPTRETPGRIRGHNCARQGRREGPCPRCKRGHRLHEGSFAELLSGYDVVLDSLGGENLTSR